MTVTQCHADDVTSIVLDVGSSWTRVGYSGENLPKHIVPTVYGRDADDKYYFGDEQVNGLHRGKEIFNPMSDGYVQDWNAMSKLWKWIYEEKLYVSPKEQPLVVTEPIWNPSVNKQRMLETVFEDLEVPAFSLVKAPMCVAYESARPTALVIDIGSAVVSVTPIVDGSLLQKAAYHTRYAGDFLNAHALAHLQHLQVPIVPPYAVEERATVEPGQQAAPKLREFPQGFITDSYQMYQTQRVLNAFKESTLQVSEFPLNMGQQAPIMSRPFEFPTGYNLAFGAERLATTEPLFRPLQYPLAGMQVDSSSPTAQGLGEIMYAALRRAPDFVTGPHSERGEVTSTLLSNIILTGGTSQLPGLVHRLENEISQWVQNYTKTRLTVPQDRYNSVWAGASIIASMGTFEQSQWITKAEYDEHGTSLVDKRFK